MTDEKAFFNGKTDQHVSDYLCMMDSDGKVFDNWRVDPWDTVTVYKVDAYGGILAAYRLGTDCVMVNRHRVTTVVETYELVK